MSLWIPTSDERKRIRAAAVSSAGKLVKMEIGARYNLHDPMVPESVNFMRVTKRPLDPTSDTDLAEVYPWSTFARGVELSHDGQALVDFYCYGLGPSGELEINVMVAYAGGQITSIKA